MTSHLESTKDHSEERVNQLKLVLKTMQEAPESSTVIFGGDTNLRDREVNAFEDSRIIVVVYHDTFFFLSPALSCFIHNFVAFDLVFQKYSVFLSVLW